MKEFNHKENTTNNNLRCKQKILYDNIFKSKENLQLNFLPPKESSVSGPITLTQNKNNRSFQPLINKSRDFLSPPARFQDSNDNNISLVSNRTFSAANKFKNLRRLPKYHANSQADLTSYTNMSNQFDSQTIKNVPKSKQFAGINLQDVQPLIFEKKSNQENHLFQIKISDIIEKAKEDHASSYFSDYINVSRSNVRPYLKTQNSIESTSKSTKISKFSIDTSFRDIEFLSKNESHQSTMPLKSLNKETFFKEDNAKFSEINNSNMEHKSQFSPKNINGIAESDDVMAIQDANDKENIIIQPKYMQKKGTMCSTELWPLRDKKQFLRDMNGMVKTIDYYPTNGYELAGEGLYRPQKLKKISLLKGKLKQVRENSIDEYALYKNNINAIQKVIIKQKKVQIEKANASDSEVNQIQKSDISKTYKANRSSKGSKCENNSKGI